MAKLIAAALWTFVLGAILAQAQSLTPALQAGTDPALLKAIDDRERAVDARDLAAVDRLTADDYSAVPVGGTTVITKAQRLTELKAQAPSSKPTRHVDEAVRVYGASAVQRLKNAGGRAVWIWTKNGGAGWRLAAVHGASDGDLPPPPSSTRESGPTPSDWVAPADLTPAQAAVFAVQKQIQDAFFNGDRATYLKLMAPEHSRVLPGGIVRFGAEGSSVIDRARPRPKHEFQGIRVWDKVAIARWKETSASGVSMLLMRVFADEGQGWWQVATVSASAVSGGTA